MIPTLTFSDGHTVARCTTAETDYITNDAFGSTNEGAFAEPAATEDWLNTGGTAENTTASEGDWMKNTADGNAGEGGWAAAPTAGGW